MIAVRIGPDMRMAVVGAPSYFARSAAAEDAAGPDSPRLHQPPPADLWRALRLGVREGRARAEGAGRRATGVQQHRPETERGPGRVRPGLSAGGSGADTSRRRTARPRARRLVPARSQATTSIIQAAGSPRRPSPCWSMRCATGAEPRYLLSLRLRQSARWTGQVPELHSVFDIDEKRRGRGQRCVRHCSPPCRSRPWPGWPSRRMPPRSRSPAVPWVRSFRSARMAPRPGPRRPATRSTWSPRPTRRPSAWPSTSRSWPRTRPISTSTRST